MEQNEISMFMDVKLDFHDKRANALRFKDWYRCEVKVEAVKCVPCFLRFTFQHCAQDEEAVTTGLNSFTVSVNVPGVTISLASSRTKQFSYGIFWAQNRRDCFIYFSLETEASCRRHMKWMRRSIKNLELYRQIFMQQRRLSRGPGRLLDTQQDIPSSELGPLPKLPDHVLNGSCMSARISEIYEEIFEGHDHSRLSRRISRTSIASGIYEEMKPSTQNFQSIVEEPPALPPLPAQRKRINTFETENNGLIGEIPRSCTNPESELAKKKKYKIMLDNFFGSARQKRSESVSECEQQAQITPFYQNAPSPQTPQSSKAAGKRQHSNISKSQRNSFSSPDLSKLNFLDPFDEAHIADILEQSDASSETFNLSLDDKENELHNTLIAKIHEPLMKTDSLESLNVSEQLPNNFNFSACNTSKINLIGAQCAVPPTNLVQRNKILVDDFTGYCIMAPIVKKTSTQLEKPTVPSTETSSGYSTGSYSSSTCSCNTADEAAKAPTNESDIYEAMMSSAMNESNKTTPTVATGFADHLYENLLAVKAAQELESPSFGLSTSTPTDSPQLPALPQKGTPKATQANTEEDDIYQTPRKSIISVDDKVPSYYPNSCDTVKTRRRSRSPERTTPTSAKSEKSTSSLRHLVNIKKRRERKENVYISSPQQITEQRQQAGMATQKTKTHGKKQSAHKISDNVYAVTHSVAPGKKSTNKSPNPTLNNNDGTFTDEMREKLHIELRQLRLLQNIDFKFDDSEIKTTPPPSSSTRQQTKQNQLAASSATISEQDEYEHCYQAAESATRLLQKYATLAKFGSSPKKSASKQAATITTTRPAAKANLSPGAASSTSTAAMTQSATNPADLQLTGMKKFASLPRFKKFDLSPLKMRLNNVLQRHPPSPPASASSLSES